MIVSITDRRTRIEGPAYAGWEASRSDIGEHTMFGPYSINKGLRSCGTLTDIDSQVFRLKNELGKEIECRECRNKRIAMEHEQLELHYLGLDEECYS